jgi:alkanesulfonate monooxygenase SsuD/methylene tetrahydromethanopterin reductase-like flavin-dependent oxidoreductase (luciferase family)
VVRAARYGIPLVLAIIGGEPLRFEPFVDLYHRALREFDQPELPVAMHSPGHVADTDEQGRDELWPHYRAQMNRIGRERGWPATTRSQFDQAAGPEGSLYVGSPETVAAKIVRNVSALKVDRFDLKYGNGTLSHESKMRSIELFGGKVAPIVREALAQQR